MNEHAVGIDVSKKKLDICVISSEKYKTKVLSNTAAGHAELLRWLAGRQLPVATPIVLEATGPYSEAVAIALADAGWAVSVVNPARVTGFAQSELSRNKTDQADAKLLAKFAQRAALAIWKPPSREVRELRALVDRLQALIDMRQQELNRLEALAQGLPSNVTDMVHEHVAWLDEQIRKLQDAIDDHIDGNPALREDAQLMQSIPGIGKRSTAQFLAYIGDTRRFKSAKALAAFIGLSPKQKQSGASVRGRTTISRAGHAAARRALYMPGLVAKRHNPVIIALAKRLESKGLAPKAIIGASMRKLVHLIYGVIKSGRPFQAGIPLRGLEIQEGI
ncbi:IS110 family RNA-guided transposase [Acidihalobacter yilgarnensis]|nr:IS110 family transposase [Acidihalobacter yilgarnensis]